MEHQGPETEKGIVYLEKVVQESRRDWMFKFGAGLNAAAGILLAIPLIGFVFSSLGKKQSPLNWIALGKVNDYPENQTRMATYRNPFTRPWDGETAEIPCWVRRLEGAQFQVFAVNCTHLGCPVRWFQESGLFMCPCHGGVYYQDGSRAAGPPPRGLFQYEYKVEKGQLWVRGGQMPTLAEPV
ncbi:MAG TPA: ubiquinol-cytochrome c reductase iron-sulfur subunit [Bryobacteraceae bacterium]|jgi:Rieske Fe-S protein|nr:ubiquinol-cytochrome c reductase iron-sulfur subunit [Bryobacteraceae bacterium]